MTKVIYKTIAKTSLIALVLSALVPSFAYADKTDTIVNSGIERLRSAAKSQKQIDKISDDTDKVIARYHQQRKQVETLKAFNDRLRRTQKVQEDAIATLKQSIENASLIERQIVPLMTRMIAGLEEFIDSDLPFKLEERKGRLDRIRGYLTNANISAAERFRKVLEAYSIENGYGKSVAVYTDTLQIDDAPMTVNILQLGRTAIYYQTTDEKESGYYNPEEKIWQSLDASHNAGISRAIKVAQKKISPELMLLPLPAPEDI